MADSLFLFYYINLEKVIYKTIALFNYLAFFQQNGHFIPELSGISP